MSPSIDPRLHQPGLEIPGGWDREQILSSLTSFSLDGGAKGELENYGREDCDRFLYTLALIPLGPLKILEIGANPYFLTYLIKKFRPEAELTLVNYFGGDDGLGTQVLQVNGFDGIEESFSLDFHHVNIETSELPFAEDSFDLVLYCEVIEHMLNDPQATLLKLKHALRPNGTLILTTPNVARLENVARLISGANIYDPYSGYGAYGRHNREYNRHELHHLLRHCGFVEDFAFTADVHENQAHRFADLALLEGMLHSRASDLGQYLFMRCLNAGPAPMRRPGWLYRSYPLEELDFDHTL